GGNAQDVVVELNRIDGRIVLPVDVSCGEIDVGDGRVAHADVEVERFIFAAIAFVVALVVIGAGGSGYEVAKRVTQAEAAARSRYRVAFAPGAEVAVQSHKNGGVR